MKILSVVGARPNFMKIAPFIRSIEKINKENGKRSNEIIEHTLVHTGQHYDVRMSESFFESLGIPNPDINLEIGSGSHAEQVGHTMIAFEKVLEKEKPDWVVVLGDVNATLACSVAAKKLHVKVCHIEAGLRSGDEKMPEVITRMRVGGASTGSAKGIVLKMQEDIRALRNNGFNYPLAILAAKNLRKLPQLLHR